MLHAKKVSTGHHGNSTCISVVCHTHGAKEVDSSGGLTIDVLHRDLACVQADELQGLGSHNQRRDGGGCLQADVTVLHRVVAETREYLCLLS